MKVLIAGANSYIARYLIPVLLDNGHEVICQVRDKKLFERQHDFDNRVTIMQGDLLRERSIESLPRNVDAAFYLVSPLSQTSGFAGLEALSATNFINAISQTFCSQVITISEIADSETSAGASRVHIEQILTSGKAYLTSFKTGLILGPGSIALELLHGLTGKTNVIIPQKWARSKTQPISIFDVAAYLNSSLLKKELYDGIVEIGGPDVLTFTQLLNTYIATFKQGTYHVTAVPYLSVKLLSHWLNLLTPLSYPSAQALLENLEHDAICTNHSIESIIPLECMPIDKILQETCLNYTPN